MSSLAIKGNRLQSELFWAAVIALGALSFGIVALSRGESVNAAWRNGALSKAGRQ
jgi:carbon starvation protein